MTAKTINTFISSINRENNEPVHNFTVDFADDLIKCNPDQYISINVISFDMLNTMYNIKDAKIEIKYGNTGINYICPIPDGNYNVYTFQKWFNDNALNVEYFLFPNNAIVKYNMPYFEIVRYNKAQNSFTFKKNIAHIFPNDSLNFIQPNKFIGIYEETELPQDGTELTGSYINLVNYNKVILRTDSVNFDVSCIENVRYTNNANKLKFSNILFWTSKADVEPFRNICYNNSDGGNSFNVMIHDKFVNQMNLQLTNELGDFILDAPDYLLVLQFSIHDKDEWFKKTLLQIAENIKQIFVLILWVAEKLS